MENSIKNSYNDYQSIVREQKENDEKLKRAEKNEQAK